MQTKRATVRGLDPAEKAVISIMNALAMHWSVGGLQVLSLLGVTGTKLQILIPEGAPVAGEPALLMPALALLSLLVEKYKY